MKEEGRRRIAKGGWVWDERNDGEGLRRIYSGKVLGGDRVEAEFSPRCGCLVRCRRLIRLLEH